MKKRPSLDDIIQNQIVVAEAVVDGGFTISVGNKVAEQVIETQLPSLEEIEAKAKQAPSGPIGFQITLNITAKATPEFAAWAEENHIEYVIGYDDENGTVLVLTNDHDVVKFRLRWPEDGR